MNGYVSALLVLVLVPCGALSEARGQTPGRINILVHIRLFRWRRDGQRRRRDMARIVAQRLSEQTQQATPVDWLSAGSVDDRPGAARAGQARRLHHLVSPRPTITPRPIPTRNTTHAATSRGVTPRWHALPQALVIAPSRASTRCR